MRRPVFQLRSIGTRLALWYACGATLTVAILFAAGYHLLERYLVHGLDLLNQAQFEQIKAHLHPERDKVDKDWIEEQIRAITEAGAVLFYIDVHTAKSGTLFRSHNLNGHQIPDIKGLREFSEEVEGIGELRVTEFVLGDFDVNIGTPLRGVRTAMEGYAEVCAGLLAAMLFGSVLLGLWISRVALQPIRTISEAAAHISSDNLNERLPVGRVRDEISELVAILNLMFDRLESPFNQIRQFTAEASHELKTPLSLIRLFSEKLLVEGGLQSAQEEAVQLQLEELARLDQIISEMLFLSRAEANAITLESRPVDPNAFLQSFAQDASVLSDHQGKRFVHAHDGEGTILVDEKRIRQVLLNLLTNALHVTPAGEAIMLYSRLASGKWLLRFEDRGPGLAESQRERILERFVRLGDKSSYPGSGLGLAICRSIVHLHHGTIRATSGSGDRGLCILIELPAPAASAA